MFVVFNRKMYVVDFYFQLFRSPMLGEVACGVATSVLRLFCAHESSISHSFSVYQVDIYAAHTSSIATRTPAAVISDGGWEEEIFEARGKHWESERRVTIVVVSFFTRKIWPQIVNLCWFSTSLFLSIEGSILFSVETHSRSWELHSWMLRGCFGSSPNPSLLLFSKNIFFEHGKKL